MRRGDIVLGYFPFGDVTGQKLRPLLLLTGPAGTGTEVVAAYVSSIIPVNLLPSDILLNPALPQFQSTRLKVVSVLRLHKIGTIHVTSVLRRLGDISPSIQQEVDAKLRGVLRL